MKSNRTRRFHQLRSLKKTQVEKKVSAENKLLAKIKRRSGMMIRLSMGFFIPEVTNRAMSRLLNACLLF